MNQLARSKTKRRGGVYLAVLGTAMLVSLVGLAAMDIARVELRHAEANDEIARAHSLAQSGVALAQSHIHNSSFWRSLVDGGDGASIEIGPTPLNPTGTISYKLIDADGDLDDDPTDSVTIRSVGRAGKATSVATVLLEPYGSGLTSLSSAMHAGNGIQIDSTILDSTHHISANSWILATSATVNAEVEAVTSILGGNYSESTTSSITPKEMPDSATVFDYYLAKGTIIDYSDLPSGKIEEVVLAPGNNPYGSGETNALGIYILDCQGNDLDINNSRIEATLVLLNAGGDNKIIGAIHWEPAVENYPALMVQGGDVIMDWNGYGTLRENTIHINYNPPAAPYLGEANSDTDDSYPNVIKGLVYVAGDLSFTSHCVFEGAMVAGNNILVYDHLDLTYQSTFFDDPPPGFSAGTEMRIVPGTWRRDTY